MGADSASVVIVGAGHAGGSAAAFLRQYGHTGSIVLVGDEPVAPYQRPPLSKAFLKDQTDAETLKLRPDAFYEAAGIDARFGVRVIGVDRTAKVIALEGGDVVPYAHLILATGSRARRLRLPGMDLEGVHALRTLADAEDLKRRLRSGGLLAVIGGGYVGLETAASALALGAQVVVLEREIHCLRRVASAPLSEFLQAYHRARGVEIRTGVEIVGADGEGGQVSAIRLSTGERLGCAAALVGIGAEPADELAREAGLVCQDGVVVDLQARTSDPQIFAIGDMTRRPLPLYGGAMMRLESVPNALEQAKQAAAAITGAPPPPPETPWFWSDQFDVKLQIAGVALEADSVVVRGAADRPGFAVYHLKGRRIRAVEAVNAPGDFMWGKSQIPREHTVDLARLADPNVAVKSTLVV